MGIMPMLESRVAVPFGVLVAQLTPVYAVALTFVGGLTLALFVTPLMYRFGDVLKAKVPIFKNILVKTQARHGKRFEDSKLIALFVLVALPFPMSGVWTGILLSYLFGIPLRHAVPILTVGALIASIFVGLIVAGVIGLVDILR